MARSRSPSRSRSRPSRHSQRDREREKDRERERDRGSYSRRRSRSRSRSRGRRREDEPRARSNSGGDGAGAKTEDKNGEISMSVEETNKLRAQLGLKPLAVGPKKSAEVNLQKTSAQVDKEREQKQLQQALAQSRKKRELSQKLAGQSLGEQLREEADARDALSWVKKSRVSTKQRAKTKQQEEEDETKAYDASALAGMTVGHAADAFEEGQEVVLTLKDTSVLAADGNDVNDADDELVNVELSERDRRSAQQSRAERAMMPAYTGYDDDEFIQMGNSRAKKRAAGGKKLLAQYDEDDDARAAEEARKFTLDASGTSTAAVARGEQNEGAGGADDDDDDGVAVISLAMDRTKAAEDYFTAEEMEAQFKKKGKKLRKKKKKLRHREEAEQDAAEGDNAEGDTSSLIAQLEAEARKNASQDRGKRKRRHVHDDDEDDGAVIAEDREGLKRFQHAREKANVAASEALAASNLAVEGGDVVQASSSAQTKRKRRPAGGVDEDAAMMDEALDIELSASLARARRLPQLQEAKREEHNAADEPMEAAAPAVPAVLAGPASEDKIALLVRNTVGVELNGAATDSKPAENGSVAPKPVGNVFGQAPGALGSSSNTVVFNDATDFETRLRNAMEKRVAQFQAVATPGIASVAANGSSSVASGQQSVSSAGADTDEEMKEEGNTNDDTEMKAEDDDEDDEDETNDVFGEEQPLVSSGLGATLALLKKTGDLREARVERQAGRANDARDRNVDEALRVKDGVKLDYRDEFGRLLTKKEAFRMLSYKFHGHGPGKKKQEKRLRQLKQELEAQKLLSAEGSTKMMEVLEKKQKAGKQAHVVLSSGS